ncbi:MAG: cytochrome c biogenesis protein CcsA [Bacteroidia bacterium]|nr:cytochrome c biogenesis protein CcsA [Bacteroidia bacterium]
MKLQWWKWLSLILIAYTIIAGFLVDVPHLAILHETIRNLYFHVSMWFTMIIIMLVSLVHSIKYLSSKKNSNDILAEECAKTGVVFGILGLITGSVWAKYTWGAWWVNDAKLNGAAATLLVYFAYLLLRGSLEDREKRARISAVYSIFAYSLMIVFILILPRLTDSLHPGNGGNPGFGNYDLDSRMRLVFYPAVIGWTLLALWIADIRARIHRIKISD